MTAAAVQVRPVAGRRDFEAFLRVPWRVYAGDPNWVPPLLVERRAHLGAGNAYFRHAEACYFLAERDGVPVGRVSAQIDELAQRDDGSRLGHFGLLEAVDQAALHALLDAAEDWLRGRGAARVEGPYSLSINDETGLLVEGFERPPRLMMNYARPWYGEALEAAGYAGAQDLLAFRFQVDRPLPQRAARLAEQAAAAPGVIERSMDPKRLKAEIDTVIDIFNDAWADNWGFVPMTAAEVAQMAKSMKPILRPDLVRIAEVGGEPAAMVVALPDLHEAIADLDGRLWPTGWARLLWRLKMRPPRDARVLLMGVRQRHRGSFLSSGLAALLMRRLHDAASAAGYREVELSWILADNTPMLRLVELLGAEPDKRYRVYRKELT